MKLKFGFKLWMALTLVLFFINIGGCRGVINRLKTRELMGVLSLEAPLYRGESASPVLLVNDDPLLKWIKADVGVITLAKFPKQFEVRTIGGCQEILVPKKATTVYINAIPPTTVNSAGKVVVSWGQKITICSPKGVRATIVLWYE